MLWSGRTAIVFAFLPPLAGWLHPIARLAIGASPRSGRVVPSPELTLILQTTGWALLMSVVTTLICTALAPVFLTRRSLAPLARLCALLTAAFFIPAVLRAYAFYWFWDFLSVAGLLKNAIVLLWSFTYLSVFFWGCLYSFSAAPVNRAALDSLAELETLPATAPLLLRMLGPSIGLAAICIFAFSLFGGIEFGLLTNGVQPVGKVVGDLLGGQDFRAAQLLLLMVVALSSLIAAFHWMARWSGWTSRLVEG
ncbi:hypothetical protein [Phenylobacterium sp.]|uniref:hypothetical protein n=1 Tax=Phenylobacterium sp. TaxID=1871053 RepID=UPI002D06969D|nr:hypothetical protein [Phenylobacterium sp.]HLZ77132.1 hypothetical protein [Phenylobacterium sp.]